MALRDEQLARIEAALKGRFFDCVPRVDKPERNGWPDDKHTQDRLSRSLAAYSLVSECELEDSVAAGFITDGSNDGGIDALVFHRATNRLIFVQGKYKPTGASPSQEEIQKTINGIREIRARNFDGFNDAVRERLDEIEEALNVANVKMLLLVVYLGDDFNAHAKQDLDNYAAELNRFSPRFEWRPCGLASVHGWLMAEQVPTTVDIDVHLEHWNGITSPRKAFYGQISAKELADIVESRGKALFQRNIRHYLGSVGLNAAIERTVRSRPGDFFYLNNGLTAIAKHVTPGIGNDARCAFHLTDVSIVNGAQTAGAITGASLSGPLSADAKMLITIIEADPAVDDFGSTITRARNHQNVVRGIDFAAQDPTQERLRQELATVAITYYYRPSAEALARRDDAFTLQEAALALACLSFRPLTSAEADRQPTKINAVDMVVTAKKEVGLLWDQDGTRYKQLFPNNVSGVKVHRYVQVYRFIDKIMAATERSEVNYDRKMFFRHGRYFTMAFVALQARSIVDRAAMQLTEEERTTLSRLVNELSELIHSATRSMETYKGQLAIFRNLGDAQPVANRVLDQLNGGTRATTTVPTPAM